MDGQLYLMEVLVDKINFFASVSPVPQKKQINIFVVFDGIAHLEIRTDVISGEGQGESSNKRKIDFNAGKSYLFPCTTKELIGTLQEFPLDVSVSSKGNPTPIGACTVPWTYDFIDMVMSAEESYGYVTPMSTRNTYKLRSDGNETGDIEIFVRLSCFGRNIQTQFQVQYQKDGRQYLFKDVNAATTFECHKYGMTGTSSDVLPIGPIYQSVDTKFKQRDNHIDYSLLQSAPDPTNNSFFALYNDDTMSIMSFMPMEFNANENGPELANYSNESIITDIASLRDRPNENKFLNQTLADDGVPEFGDEEESDENVLLTPEVINQRLCTHVGCPAAIKFKEYGLGPLATGPGLGCIYGKANTSLNYGMSQTYGTMDTYGPYGIFTKPKRPNQKFIPKDAHKCVKETPAKKECCCKVREQPLRLRGGGQVYPLSTITI